MMQGQIIPEACIACGICQLKAEQIFDYDDEGIAYFKNADQAYRAQIPDDQVEAFRQALTHCPTGAIQRVKN
ncbi:ferredoxin [Aerococcus sanguinicola]|nr:MULTISPECIES: ferredoxin [Aerococcus]MDK6232954.1 ferredoxin [Aerococcus sp. UMB10185]MDK6804602.1 ferredoxin [Aerococcus sp. UMB7834]MDK7051021.1 ferredoxin [Aerococcus sanguinicola]MDK8502079.1 ferredoxin [Aerococcus sp. UMB1112A]